MACLLLLLPIIGYVAYRVYQHFFPAPNIDTKGKYVLISGCDSGFGNALALELDKEGFNVLAGVLLPDNITKLQGSLSKRAKVFRLDISKQEDIDNAYRVVKDETPVLHGLVNNAGIAVAGFIEWTPMESLRKVMEVNFFGHVAMTKKFLPLLTAKSDSRVVNICSVAGYLASSSMSAYCASKYALEAFSDCLRREMAPWNLRVSIIEPGFMRTPIIQGRPATFDDFWSKLDTDVQERWGRDYFQKQFTSSVGNIFIKKAEDPMKVVRVLQHAVTSTQPCIRYRPGWQSSLVFFPISMLPAWVADWVLINMAKGKRLPAGVANQLTN